MVNIGTVNNCIPPWDLCRCPPIYSLVLRHSFIHRCTQSSSSQVDPSPCVGMWNFKIIGSNACHSFSIGEWVAGWLFVGWQQQRMAKWTRKHWVGGGRVGTINRLKESLCPGNPQLISLTQTVLLVLLYVPGWMVVERTHCCCCCEGGWIAAILKTFHFCHITNERQPIIKFCTARQAFGQQTDRASRRGSNVRYQSMAYHIVEQHQQQ